MTVTKAESPSASFTGEGYPYSFGTVDPLHPLPTTRTFPLFSREAILVTTKVYAVMC
ncbi:MAG: hypothetical protein PUP92_26485 [Rhizonema sp. PD38]|nr:hypothetical protein [Rhizonema sp. PD38]